MSQLDTSMARRTAFQMGAWMAPGLAGRLGWTLFCTPMVASRPTPLQSQVLAQAGTSEIAFGGRQLRLYRWGTGQGPVVLAVHGWGGRAHVFGHIVQELTRRGFTVVSFDAPAHNDRGGRTNMLEYSAAIKLVARRIGPVEGLIGHSFGAMTAAYTAAELPDLKGLCLLGAPDSLGFVLERAQSMMTVPNVVMDYIYGRVEKLSGRPVDDHAVRLYLSSLAVPKLFIHCRDDKEIPVEQARALSRALEADFVETEGLGHHRILSCPDVARQVGEFFTPLLSPQQRKCG